VVLNAANEVAVAAFLEERCRFVDIPRLVAEALQAYGSARADDLEACLAVDTEVRASVHRALAGDRAGLAGVSLRA
jgi:1-deoxy-D-xylulose-5-phosphate reductoisomerase